MLKHLNIGPGNCLFWLGYVAIIIATVGGILIVGGIAAGLRVVAS